MRQAGQACAAGRKARPAGPHAAVAERPGGAGNIFAPCVISGSSTRKRALGGKIRAPCILNRPIAPGNGCMGRGCCHSDLEEHAFRADAAREGAFFAHSAKKGCMRCDSCQPRARGRRNARGGRGRRRAVGAMWTRRAQWVRAAAGRYSGGGGAMSAGSGRTAESNAGERRRWRTGAGCGRWLISGCSGTVAVGDGCCEGGCVQGKGK